MIKLNSFKFQSAEEGRAIASFEPETIAAAIEELGSQFAIANERYEQTKHQSERVFAELVQNSRKIVGSISGAESLARTDPSYQDTLSSMRTAEREKIIAQSSFRAAEAYSKMAITKVSSEAKIGEYYKKNTVT